MTAMVHSGKPGWLVIAESWDPGWSAAVNGLSAPVRRVNYVQRGVEVPAGDSTVEFRYRPPYFGPAACLSILSWLFAGLWLWREALKRYTSVSS